MYGTLGSEQQLVDVREVDYCEISIILVQVVVRLTGDHVQKFEGHIW